MVNPRPPITPISSIPRSYRETGSAGSGGEARKGCFMTGDETGREHDPRLRAFGPGHNALRKGRVSLPHHVYLVTAATVNRERLFMDFSAGCAAARCFEDRAVLRDTGMLAWVLMPDHAHWLIQLGRQDRLGGVVGRLKSASARRVNPLLGRSGALWAPAFHDHALRSEERLREAARYIAANPVRAGLVARTGDYPFWNAVWV